LWVAPQWHTRIAAHAPAYMNLEEPAHGLDTTLVADARRFDVASQDLATVAAAIAAFDVLEDSGFAAIHERAVMLATTLTAALGEMRGPRRPILRGGCPGRRPSACSCPPTTPRRSSPRRSSAHWARRATRPRRSRSSWSTTARATARPPSSRRWPTRTRGAS